MHTRHHHQQNPMSSCESWRPLAHRWFVFSYFLRSRVGGKRTNTPRILSPSDKPQTDNVNDEDDDDSDITNRNGR
ncbi:hypothetical protein ZHAS_00001878 [Anopheles sinensis]|uniref:Uncharacterized protein n=1 Tax=Anopheles sinensis TaxID=74873 RepID=A0A084VBM3_ANOSI|nr:hypothetical protein ZHAS_00001878 [Anopheles sinensis]